MLNQLWLDCFRSSETKRTFRIPRTTSIVIRHVNLRVRIQHTYATNIIFNFHILYTLRWCMYNSRLCLRMFCEQNLITSLARVAYFIDSDGLLRFQTAAGKRNLRRGNPCIRFSVNFPWVSVFVRAIISRAFERFPYAFRARFSLFRSSRFVRSFFWNVYGCTRMKISQ